jgi:hypothetical protein
MCYNLGVGACLLDATAGFDRQVEWSSILNQGVEGAAKGRVVLDGGFNV